MVESRKTISHVLTLCFALRHLGEVRELLILKAESERNRIKDVYAFPPFAYPKKPAGGVDSHASWHESGEYHLAFKFTERRRQQQVVRYVPTVEGGYRIAFKGGHDSRNDEAIGWKEMRVPPAELKGVGQLLHSCLFLGQFPELPPFGTSVVTDSVILDAEAANFQDDLIVVRAHLVEPGAEDCIPPFPCNPCFPTQRLRIVRLIKRTNPWLAVELFQEARVR